MAGKSSPKPLRSFLRRETFDLPIDANTVYTVQEPDAEVAVYVQRMFNVAMAARDGDGDAAAHELLDDELEGDLYERLFGEDLYAQMIATLNWSEVKHCATTVMMWIVHGRDTAELVWEAGGDPGEAPAPNRAQRRAASRSGAARSTKSRASGSGTTSRPTRPKASRGRSS